MVKKSELVLWWAIYLLYYVCPTDGARCSLKPFQRFIPRKCQTFISENVGEPPWADSFRKQTQRARAVTPMARQSTLPSMLVVKKTRFMVFGCRQLFSAFQSRFLSAGKPRSSKDEKFRPLRTVGNRYLCRFFMLYTKLWKRDLFHKPEQNDELRTRTKKEVMRHHNS